MKKTILLTLSHLLVAVLAAFLALQLTPAGFAQGANSKLDQLEKLILERFIGEADQTAMEDAAAEAMVASLGDRWSYYIPASEYASYLEQVQNAYVGVGMTIQLSEDGQGFLIIDVTEGGPAEAAGVQVDDVLVEIEGNSTVGMDVNQARDHVRGEEGTTVRLVFLRNGERRELDVERKRIETAVAEWQMLEGNVGLIKIVNFDQRCAQETLKGIEELLDQGAKSLIFDLRGNPGGYASEMVKILDYLLPEGDLFRTLDYAGRETLDKSDADFLDIPMVAIVNGESYSAAEFFAQALREYDAALVVGEKTSGKGYFQNTLVLNDGSAVGLSVGKYFTPKGESLAGVGVTPDVEIPLDDETWYNVYYGRINPMEDPHILAALELLK